MFLVLYAVKTMIYNCHMALHAPLPALFRHCLSRPNTFPSIQESFEHEHWLEKNYLNFKLHLPALFQNLDNI